MLYSKWYDFLFAYHVSGSQNSPEIWVKVEEAHLCYNWLLVIQIATEGAWVISPAASVVSSLLVFGLSVLQWLRSDINGSVLFQWRPAGDRTWKNKQIFIDLKFSCRISELLCFTWSSNDNVSGPSSQIFGAGVVLICKWEIQKLVCILTHLTKMAVDLFLI